MTLLGDNPQHYNDWFICTLYSMSEGIVERTRNRDEVFSKTGIGAFPDNEIGAADAIVQYLAVERKPPLISLANERNVRLTADGLRYCRQNCEVWITRLGLRRP